MSLLLLTHALNQAEATTTEATLQSLEPQTPAQVETYIRHQFELNNLNPELGVRLANCESGFVPQQSQHLNPKGPNGREDSWGVWQINLPYHPVTREQAMSVTWSTGYTIEKIKSGFKNWTCWPKGF